MVLSLTCLYFAAGQCSALQLVMTVQQQAFTQWQLTDFAEIYFQRETLRVASV